MAAPHTAPTPHAAHSAHSEKKTSSVNKQKDAFNNLLLGALAYLGRKPFIPWRTHIYAVTHKNYAVEHIVAVVVSNSLTRVCVCVCVCVCMCVVVCRGAEVRDKRANC